MGLRSNSSWYKICKARDDQWSQEVIDTLNGVIDFPAPDAQYHKPCNDRFRIIPVKTPFSDDDDLYKLMKTINGENLAWLVDYDFSSDNVIESTGDILRESIFSLVSDGLITKQSLTLVQCIQQDLV